MDDGFPRDTYTPHGYLANPWAVAHSWSDGSGGCLRSSREHVGFGWQLPWALRAEASLDLVVGLEAAGKHLARRADFVDAGLVSSHHSATLFTYRWRAFGRTWTASYVVVGRDALGLTVTWAADDTAGPPPPVTLRLGLVAQRAGAPVPVLGPRTLDLGEPYGIASLEADPSLGDEPAVGPAADGGAAAVWLSLRATAEQGTASAIARRTPDATSIAAVSPRAVERQVSTAVADAGLADDAFWRGSARLAGDWPTSWRRGWVYDVETTRMCVMPPGGIFADVWPAWMIQWPRAVVAEGTLDMARFGYASPALATRAVLSLFRDAEAANVPCVFQHGEPNMVAKDGSVCGTSPAWCVPFYNLERLFAQTLDRDWLAAIYPFLARYVEWWLAERTDAEGWAVYKCTWEAGEDDSPRLDPERRGDNVVSAFVRPVELQATMALSAGVLARFADALARPDEAGRWRDIAGAYARRTQVLWDGTAGRFRDWDARAGRFQEPSGTANYWGVDVCRYSALAFTPVLAGLANAAQRAGLRRELAHYDGPPWTLWASWSSVVLEAAGLLGERQFAGRVAGEIVGRVYAELDAREIGGPSRPTPGVAREFWPLDLDTWASCEGYGWGANTASLLVRQIVGFVEGSYDATGVTDGTGGTAQAAVDVAARAAAQGGAHAAAHGTDAGPAAPPSGWRAAALVFDLRPALPDQLLVADREYLLAGLPYRGARLTVGYRVAPAAEADPSPVGGPDGAERGGEPGAATGTSPPARPLTLLVSAAVPTGCRVLDDAGRVIYAAAAPADRHEIAGRNGTAYRVELRPG